MDQDVHAPDTRENPPHLSLKASSDGSVVPGTVVAPGSVVKPASPGPVVRLGLSSNSQPLPKK